MENKTPTDRVARIIATMIGCDRLFKCPASMFSADSCNAVFHGIAIAIMARTNGSNVFFIAIEL